MDTEWQSKLQYYSSVRPSPQKESDVKSCMFCCMYLYQNPFLCKGLRKIKGYGNGKSKRSVSLIILHRSPQEDMGIPYAFYENWSSGKSSELFASNTQAIKWILLSLNDVETLSHASYSHRFHILKPSPCSIQKIFVLTEHTLKVVPCSTQLLKFQRGMV